MIVDERASSVKPLGQTNNNTITTTRNSFRGKSEQPKHSVTREGDGPLKVPTPGWQKAVCLTQPLMAIAVHQNRLKVQVRQPIEHSRSNQPDVNGCTVGVTTTNPIQRRRVCR